jgi:hypothetical protein
MTEANKATVCVYLQDNQSPAEKKVQSKSHD